MKPLSRVLAMFLLAASGLLCWHILKSGRAEWLMVETSPCAVRGGPFSVKVILTEPAAGKYLGVDLHFMDKNKAPQGFLCGSRPLEIAHSRNVYEFSLDVPVNSRAAYIFPVMVVSKDGSWGGRISAAATGPVSVIGPCGIVPGSRNVWRSAHNMLNRSPAPEAESGPLRFIIAGLWAFAALLFIVFRRNIRGRFIPAAALASAAWEFFNAGSLAGGMFRELAQAAGIYGYRRGPQQFITVLVILSLAALTLYLVTRLKDSGESAVWLALSVYWGVSLSGLLSLHEIDAMLSAPAAGIPVSQVLKMVTALGGTVPAIAAVLNRKQEGPVMQACVPAGEGEEDV